MGALPLLIEKVRCNLHRKIQIAIGKGVWQLGLVTKGRSEGRKQQLFLSNPKGWSCVGMEGSALLADCTQLPVSPPASARRAQLCHFAMLRALLSWLESRACFQACISHLAAHDAAGGQCAASLFCQTSELVSDTESGKEQGGEMQGGMGICAGGLARSSGVIAWGWCSVLAEIEWQRFGAFFPFVFLVISVTCKWKLFSSLFLSGRVCIQGKSSV